MHQIEQSLLAAWDSRGTAGRRGEEGASHAHRSRNFFAVVNAASVGAELPARVLVASAVRAD
jgi:hypothetical protein